MTVGDEVAVARRRLHHQAAAEQLATSGSNTMLAAKCLAPVVDAVSCSPLADALPDRVLVPAVR